MPLETELKLILPDSKRIRSKDLFRALGVKPQKRGRRSAFVSTYFDSPGEELAAKGIALRIRADGKGKTQTLKIPAAGAFGLNNFTEIEGAVRSDTPSIELISDAKLSKSLAQTGIWSRLRPRFKTDFRRTAWPIRFGESTIELAWDVGRIVAGKKSEPINEIELELKEGSAKDIYAVAEALLEALPYRIGRSTKAQRGFALLHDVKPGPVKARPAPLTSADDVATGFEKIAKTCLDQLSANENAILQSADPEAIHQIRVALRRFRAILGPFRQLIDDGVHAAWSIDLRWAQRQFGPARDLDVFISETARPMLSHLAFERGLAQLLLAAESARDSARRAAILAIENPRYPAMHLQMLAALNEGRWRHKEQGVALSAPILNFANDVLHRGHKKLRRFGLNWSSLSDADLHRLRILVKKQRYALGLFEPLYHGKRLIAYSSALSGLQDCLGAVNDAVVGRQLLREFADKLKVGPQESPYAIENLDRALGLVAGWQARGIEDQRKSFNRLWAEFQTARRFWRKPKD